MGKKTSSSASFTERLKTGTWFGFAEVDIEIPKKLWMKFEEMPPFFFAKQIPEEAVPRHMKDYAACTGRKRSDGKKLVGALSAEKLLLYAPLLRWYVEHGAVIKAVHRTIDYQATKIFSWFVEEVTEARRTGDVDKSKALLAEVFKLLGNSAYGKLIEALERQTCVVTRPFQIGIAVYQLAKLRMLQFYYDFLDRYLDRRDFDLIQMDTDSNYIAISAERLEDLVWPERRAEFEEKKKEWLAWDKWSGRTPGLFKLECEGSRMIALCSKCYFVDEKDGEKKKFSTKGISKRRNLKTWQSFKAALDGSIDRAENRGFRMVRSDGAKRMATYKQQKLGLSAYYDKRWVLSDDIHTEPIEFHAA